MKKIIIPILILITMIVFVGCGNKQASQQNDVQHYMQEHGTFKYVDPYYKQLSEEYFKEHPEIPEPLPNLAVKPLALAMGI